MCTKFKDAFFCEEADGGRGEIFRADIRQGSWKKPLEGSIDGIMWLVRFCGWGIVTGGRGGCMMVCDRWAVVEKVTVNRVSEVRSYLKVSVGRGMAWCNGSNVWEGEWVRGGGWKIWPGSECGEVGGINVSQVICTAVRVFEGLVCSEISQFIAFNAYM